MKRIATIGTLLAAATTFGLAGCSGGGSGTGAGIAPPPLTAQADSFALAANLPAATIPAAIGVLANDPAGATIVASDAQSLLGGTVTVNPDGSFTFEPAAGVTGTDTFNYSVDSAGTISSATVTVDLTAKAIFVDPAAAPGGNGHHATPFDTLAAGLAAAGIGDTVFVKAGDGTTPLNANAPVVLTTGLKLIGEAAGLSIEVKDGEWVEVVAPSVVDPLDPAPPAIYPRLATDATIADSTVHMANGSELSGFSVQGLGILVDPDPALNEGIATISAAGVSGFKIHGNVIADPSGPGIAVADMSGAATITNNTMTGLTGEHAGIDLFFRLASSTAQLNVSGNDITVVDGELASAIAVLARSDNIAITHDITLVMDGNTVRGGRGQEIDPLGIEPPITMPDISLFARGTATICVELTNTTSPTPPGTYEGEVVGGGVLQAVNVGNGPEIVGAALVASCN